MFSVEKYRRSTFCVYVDGFSADKIIIDILLVSIMLSISCVLVLILVVVDDDGL